MAMGMSYEQFWDGTPHLAVVYRKAYKIRREIDNEKAWLQGLYVYDAFAVCMANVFAKRGSRKPNYMERPIDIFPISEREKKRREKEEYAKMQKAMEAMRLEQQRRKKQRSD